MTEDRSAGPNPNVDELTPAFTETSVEERIYRLIVQSGDEWSAPAVAERLECSTDTARKYLNWFTELGIEFVFIPPYSPTLNAIEPLWKDLKREISPNDLRRKRPL